MNMPCYQFHWVLGIPGPASFAQHHSVLIETSDSEKLVSESQVLLSYLLEMVTPSFYLCDCTYTEAAEHSCPLIFAQAGKQLRVSMDDISLYNSSSFYDRSCRAVVMNLLWRKSIQILMFDVPSPLMDLPPPLSLATIFCSKQLIYFFYFKLIIC